ncbi:alpha/beta hydrolase fold domain-containing protein [Streptomyces sp. 6N223]|uniref:alpha/beta hydrolase fold domain-containing protein n=1 Tax=Streptomyces sp. 6N223 TaxID=3457412 RepID=UPI003FD1714E
MKIVASVMPVVLAVAAAVLLVLGAVLAYLMFFDTRPGGPARLLRAFPLHVLVLSLAALLVVALALREGQRPAAVVAALAAVVTALTALVPTMALVGTAGDLRAPVSLGTYLGHAFSRNAGEPDPERSVTYAEPEGHRLRLDVWLSDRPGPRPAVVLLHGGAWRSGHRGATPEWNRWLTEQGYHVFDADYRLVGEVPEGTAWQTSVRDARCAVAWVAAHAERYGVDPDRISVMGRSAGAQLAMMAAYAGDDDARFEPSCPLPVPQVSAVVELFGRADLTLFDGGDNATARDTLTALTGGGPEEYPERYAAASPVRHVTPDDPPTLMLTGESDHLVPPAQARALAEALEASGVPHRARYFPFTDHDFDHNWGGLATQASQAEIRRFLARYG